MAKAQLSQSLPEKDKPFSGEDKDIQENKLVALLSYIGILFLIPLLAKRESKFAQYHAKQGLVLFLAEIILWATGFIYILGWIIGFFGWIFCLILAIVGIINVLQGKYWVMPVLGKYAGKFNI